jgi:hypothetical protein
MAAVMSLDILAASAACLAGAVQSGVEAAGVPLLVVAPAPALPPTVRTVAAASATAADPAARTVGIPIFTGVRYIESITGHQAQNPANMMTISLHV